jgi:hypothetical protein
MQQVMNDNKLDHIRQGPEGRTDPTADSQGEIIRRLLASETRLGKLEAWVEVVMRTLATLGLEGLLIELDGARGAGRGARTTARVTTTAVLLYRSPVSEYPARNE